MKRFICMVTLVTTLQGCAYLTTYNKPIDLKDSSVSLDVKQRVVFSQKREARDGEKEGIVVCAEPSPDALTILGVSGGLNASDGTRAASAAVGLAESGAFVGLRTQSIQLLRDAMYRLCEGYASGAVNGVDYAAMQRRYQSTMLGLIAIEQLTRPVVAGQALLASSVGAKAGAEDNDEAITKSEDRVKAATEEHLTTQANVDKAVSTVEEKQSQLRALQNQLSAERSKESPDSEQIKALEAQRQTAHEEVTAAQLALADANRRESSAAANVRSANARLLAATNKSSASANADGQLGQVARWNSESTAYLTEGVRRIVADINNSYTKDACIALMTTVAKTPSTAAEVETWARSTKTGPASPLGTAIDVCNRILVSEEQRLNKLATQPETPISPNSPSQMR